MKKNWLTLCTILLLQYTGTLAQQTTGEISGFVLDGSGNALYGATVYLYFGPSGNSWRAVTNDKGRFYFSFLSPGGPYTLSASFIGFKNVQIPAVSVSVGERQEYNIVLTALEAVMDTVSVSAKALPFRKGGAYTLTSQDLMKMPSLSRGMQDFIRTIPQVNVNGEGVMSFAGQNNRFNACHVDGVSVTDLLGLAPSGTNGGQTGAAPISIESIASLSVQLAPYDVEYGNFTGGSIQAVTRRGSGHTEAAAWYYFRNEKMAGRSPIFVTTPTGARSRPSLPDFTNQTSGAWASGPLINKRLFYFILFEHQEETRPIQWDLSSYRGNSAEPDLQRLRLLLLKKYGYDAGEYKLAYDNLNVNRVNIRLDHVGANGQEISASYRLNSASRISPRVQSTRSQVGFSNTSFYLPTTNHAASLEWKHTLTPTGRGRLLASWTGQEDDRSWAGTAFPRVSIRDGGGNIEFGSDAASSLTYFNASDWGIQYAWTKALHKGSVKAGLGTQFISVRDMVVNSFFGFYVFDSLGAFERDLYPAQYTRGFSSIDRPADDRTRAGARFNKLQSHVYIGHTWNFRKNWSLVSGLRLDRTQFPKPMPLDRYFNDTASPIISRYYDLKGARTGGHYPSPVMASPRLGLQGYISPLKLHIHTGAGLFGGSYVNVWASNLYLNGVGRIQAFSPGSVDLRFIPDAYQQPGPERFSLQASQLKGALNIVAPGLRPPMVLRANLTMARELAHGWKVSVEGLWTRNVHEAGFTNVNLMPPTSYSAGVGSRKIYTPGLRPPLIPMPGSDPYEQVILLDNIKGKPGSAGSLTITAGGKLFGVDIIGNYTYGYSKTYFEITGSASSMLLQWQNVETVEGRNRVMRSVSDNAVKHRTTWQLSRDFSFFSKKLKTGIFIFYQGQSGAPFSYVYDQSMVNDLGLRTNMDLVYIPSSAEISKMKFEPLTVNGTVYSPEVQQKAFDQRIERDSYLRKRRGGFAERNGTMSVFTHSLDLRLENTVIVQKDKREYRITLFVDVFNLLNLLNNDWGIKQVVLNDQYRLLNFLGYTNSSDLVPRYQYLPRDEQPYTVQGSTVPGNNSMWLMQLGLRMQLK